MTGGFLWIHRHLLLPQNSTNNSLFWPCFNIGHRHGKDIQFGFMFFEDQRAVLIEMMRVLQRGGQLTVAVCDTIDHSPDYAVLAELLHRLYKEAEEAFQPFTTTQGEVEFNMPTLIITSTKT